MASVQPADRRRLLTARARPPKKTAMKIGEVEGGRGVARALGESPAVVTLSGLEAARLVQQPTEVDGGGEAPSERNRTKYLTSGRIYERLTAKGV